MAGRGRTFLETRFFGLVIGVLVFQLMLALSTQTVLISNLELSVLDFNFRLKNVVRGPREREAALFLDIFFVEPSAPAHDALLVKSIAENGRVFLETILERVPNAPGT